MVRLTDQQRGILACLPWGLAVGHPLQLVAQRSNRTPGATRAMLSALMSRGLAEREKPNEEWPYIYALTDAGRAALENPHD